MKAESCLEKFQFRHFTWLAKWKQLYVCMADFFPAFWYSSNNNCIISKNLIIILGTATKSYILPGYIVVPLEFKLSMF